MGLIGDWRFTAADGGRDRAGGFGDLDLRGFAGLSRRGLELGWGSWARAPYLQGPAVREKTLVAWVRMTKVDDPRQGGAVITLAADDGNGEPFDGLAFGDTGDFGWMASSDYNARTNLQTVGAEDQAGSWGKLLKMVVTWRDAGDGTAEVTIYRQPIGRRQRRGALEQLQQFQQGQLDTRQPGETQVTFGPRFLRGWQPQGHVTCTVVAAQVYDTVLPERALDRLETPLVRTTAAGGVEPSETFALIIGVQDYLLLDDSARTPLGTSDLKGVTNDVRSYAMLTRLMGVPATNIRVLTAPRLGPNDFASVVMGREQPVDMNMVDASFGHATQREIRAGLGWLSAQLRAHPDAQGLVFFAGHSITTTAGHPAFAAMDTRRRADSGAPLAAAVDDDEAWGRYLLLAGAARRLGGVLGRDDPDAIAAAFEGCFDPSGEVTPEQIAASVEAGGADLSQPQTRALLRDLVQMSGGRGCTGTFQAVRGLGFDAQTVQSALRDDPLSQDGELDGLVSMVYAFAGSLLPLPEDRAVTFILETCLPSSGARTAREHYTTHSMPLAHGNIAVVASCSLGESSYAGVFDNRWHGAFTWALTSQLSQWDVVVSDAGRYFKPAYDHLLAKVDKLMAMMGFPEQTPVFWGQAWARQWPVFGRGVWEEQQQQVGLLRRVKVKEEINPGTTGNIMEIQSLNGEPRGFLIVTTPSAPVDTTTFNGVPVSFAENTETWTNGLPEGPFKLVRPGSGPLGGDDLAAWIKGNLQEVPSDPVIFTARSFGAGGGGTLDVPAHWEVRRILPNTQPPGTLLALVEKTSPGELKWFVESNPGPTNKLAFIVGNSVVMPPGQRVVFQPRPPRAGVVCARPVLTDSA